MSPGIAGAIVFLGRVRSAWRDDHASGLAAEVAFFGLLSVFPGVLSVAAAVGWLDGLFGERLLRNVERRLLEVLEMFLTENAGGATRAVEALFREGNGGVFTLGMGAALWSSSRAVAAALRAIGAIYDADEQRSTVRRVLVALGLAVGTMLVVALMLVMLVLGPLLGAGRAAAGAVGLGDVYVELWRWLGMPVAFIVLVGWALLILHAAPHVHRTWRSHIVAGAFVGAAWILGSLGLRAYLAVFGGNPVFGVLGGALVILLWLYLLALALMFGAELDVVLHARDECSGRNRCVTEGRGMFHGRSAGKGAAGARCLPRAEP